MLTIEQITSRSVGYRCHTFEYAATETGFTLTCPQGLGAQGRTVDYRFEVTVRKGEK